ncbi:hypothetical protein F5Y18DRAFT_397411 [Xylariaceae sp. FL1019]|nr:hypothetical protein F5Y18DRAFT_397411 [Xylariaceae sp. FL1019]
MPPRQTIRYLKEVFWRGLHSGMRFETFPVFEVDAEGNTVRTRRFLLRFDKSRLLLRQLMAGMNTTNRRVICHMLADVYLYAAKMVEYVTLGEPSPSKYFAIAKSCREWGQKVDDDLFWNLTRRLFHARALYLATFPRPSPHSQKNELAAAIDAFSEAFEKQFPLDHRPVLPPFPTDLQLERAADERFDREQLHFKFFGLSYANQQGDGDDHTITEIIPPEDYGVDQYVKEMQQEQDEAVPEDLDQPWGWMIDLGPRTPRFGHKGEAEKLQDALDKQDEEAENEVPVPVADDDTDDEDVAMDMSDDEMDIDMSSWTI